MNNNSNLSIITVPNGVLFISSSQTVGHNRLGSCIDNFTFKVLEICNIDLLHFLPCQVFLLYITVIQVKGLKYALRKIIAISISSSVQMTYNPTTTNPKHESSVGRVSSLHYVVLLSFCSFSYSGVCFNRLELSIYDVIVGQKSY